MHKRFPYTNELCFVVIDMPLVDERDVMKSGLREREREHKYIQSNDLHLLAACGVNGGDVFVLGIVQVLRHKCETNNRCSCNAHSYSFSTFFLRLLLLLLLRLFADKLATPQNFNRILNEFVSLCLTSITTTSPKPEYSIRNRGRTSEQFTKIYQFVHIDKVDKRQIQILSEIAEMNEL